MKPQADEKENTLNTMYRSKDYLPPSAEMKYLKISDRSNSGFNHSKTSHFTSISRQKKGNLHRRKDSSFTNKRIYEGQSLFPETQVSGKVSDSKTRSDSALDSGNSTESAISSASSTPSPVLEPASLQRSRSDNSESSAYRQQRHQRRSNHSFQKGSSTAYSYLNAVHTATAATQTTSDASNEKHQSPYSIVLTEKDLLRSHELVVERNQLFQNAKMDPEVGYLIAQLSYQAKDCLYLQYHNLQQFYQEKRNFELNKVNQQRLSAKIEEEESLSGSQR